jgi:putative nucleotidyltransferase with HDIG domain
MERTVVRPVAVSDARDLAEAVLRGLPDRWRHTTGVARRAEQVAATVPAGDRAVLVAAAWLHDIGYAPAAAETGFHPVDGAELLRRHRWPERIVGLVAHHSGASFVAAAHGLETVLAGYPREESPVADGLTYADLTTGPQGQPMTVAERLAEMLRRHGPASPHALVHHLRAPALIEAADRVEQRLRALTHALA